MRDRPGALREAAVGGAGHWAGHGGALECARYLRQHALPALQLRAVSPQVVAGVARRRARAAVEDHVLAATSPVRVGGHEAWVGAGPERETCVSKVASAWRVCGFEVALALQ